MLRKFSIGFLRPKNVYEFIFMNFQFSLKPAMQFALFAQFPCVIYAFQYTPYVVTVCLSNTVLVHILERSS